MYEIDHNLDKIKETWSADVKLDIGHFANVIDTGGGRGIAITTDGVGTKVLIAEALGKYDTIGIDCVAVCVNDLLCVGATPLAMVDCMSFGEPPGDDIMQPLLSGLIEGAWQANISIVGGETAILRHVLSTDTFDIVGAAIGAIPLDGIITGKDILPGDVVVGIESNGIHSNGMTLARNTLFGDCDLRAQMGASAANIAFVQELLRPTFIYVKEILAMLDEHLPVKALIHITGGGFTNLSRVDSEVGFILDMLPSPPSIFQIIQARGQLGSDVMFKIFNMGIGFCVVCSPNMMDKVISIVGQYGKKAFRIGYAFPDAKKSVIIRHIREEEVRI